MELTPISTDPDSLKKYVELFKACFPKAAHYNQAYLDWQYVLNPEGYTVGFNAWEGDQLAAHYATIPVRALVQGQQKRGLLSLNTATHPDFQGKGLFTKLAERTYEQAAASGFEFVYGIANANSTPGFIKKLGFSLVRPLNAMIGFVAPVMSDVASSFERIWDDKQLKWRAQCPSRELRYVKTGNSNQFLAFGNTDYSGVYAVARIRQKALPVQEEHSPKGLRLYLGIEPGQESASLMWNIPNKLRPSPLNLIYRSLNNHVSLLSKDAVRLTFVDFDAY